MELVMVKKSSPEQRRRGDAQWLAWGFSGLVMVVISPKLFGLAAEIFETFLEDDLWKYDFAEILIYPIFVLCLITGFFALALLLRFIPQIGILAVLMRKVR